ncbi:hypothetical protein Pedsa_1389 [Pseudopedobacter saltans DSM 12145]|uniref:DUF4251 domain-containing protein n=1 Tax=Pseudopedobacter saltans (strain ATCC 51119 / DSM 12145 / JCM 21818 / CCUG 39354 / LMG 10337 / NBRC 100064 / NCIMB 13643) TaxID=762903 RepID=F0SER5_PSESL|nr:DUF4251 domain-containing protein [Pseudopedobacter saltans]ADY51955.1 hypothetical protein Pedsa_1389 [Pseudopedobacter saltans DSM 12145]
MKFIKMPVCLVITVLLGSVTLFAQVKGDKLKQLIKDQEYVFVAQSALSQRGTNINLTSEYDLKVGKTQIESYLPFYGRAYTAPMDPTEGGIKFTSKNFKYKEKLGKKGGWEIVIVPTDYKEINSMALSISENGYATLSVNSNQRSNISFYGYIMPKPEKKEKGEN